MNDPNNEHDNKRDGVKGFELPVTQEIYALQDRLSVSKRALAELGMPVELPEGYTAVDIGSYRGALLQELAKAHPGIELIGLEGNKVFHDQAVESLPPDSKIQLRQTDVGEGLQMKPGSVDMFTCMGVVHEIYTQKGSEGMTRFFKEMYQSLEENGTVVIRDPIVPDDPDELLTVRLGDTPSAITRGHGEQSPQALMEKFYQYHLSRASDAKPSEVEKIIDETDPSKVSYKLSARLMGEFLRMRTFNDNEDHWSNEIGETHAVLDVAAVEKVARESGLEVELCLPVTDPNYYAAVAKDEGIVILGSDGMVVDPDKRFPSHVISVLRKPGETVSKIDAEVSRAYSDEVKKLNERLNAALKAADPNFKPSEEDLVQTYQLLAFLENHIDLVVAPIHDLWAASRINTGYRYGEVRNGDPAKGDLTHPLLVPITHMSNITVERYLAIGDIRGLELALMARTIQKPEMAAPSELGQEQISKILATVIYLSRDEGFLRNAAVSIHANWANIEQTKGKLNPGYTPDKRSEVDFSGLSESDQRVTITNIRSDILAVILYLAQFQPTTH